MNSMISAADIVDVIREFCASNEAEEYAVSLVTSIGARLLGVNHDCMEAMMSGDWWGYKCPDCNNPVRCECVINEHESMLKRTEKIYSCHYCGAAWVTVDIDGIESKPTKVFYRTI